MISREDQKSNCYIVDEISRISALGTVLPILFLIVSFIMLYIMLKRLAEQERGEIGTFKAFGYKDTEILLGYVLYGVIVGIVSFLIGFSKRFIFNRFCSLKC